MKPLEIGTNRQLFLGPWADDGRDAHLVESMSGVEMTMNEARVTGESLLPMDRPWEGTGMLDMRQFVIKDGDIFRMYYSALPKFPTLWTEPYCRVVCYAESSDGIHWEKPKLGLWEWEGSRENNIVLPNDDFPYVFSEAEGFAPFIDPNAPPDSRYKSFVKITPVTGENAPADNIPQKAQYAVASSDGIHWHLMTDRPVHASRHNDTQFSTFRDERIGKYVQYGRLRDPDPQQVEYYRSKYGVDGRENVLKVPRAESEDYLHWTEAEVVIAPDEIDREGWPEGVRPLDFYGGNVCQYDGIPDAYVALPNAYGHWKLDPQRAHRGKVVQLPGTMDVQLMTSRDGIHFNRTPGRKPFIRMGPEGTFWSRQIYPGSEIITVGDELWIFFAGLNVGHKEQTDRESASGRGRAVLRKDGFISADAAYTGGTLTTRPLIFEGNRLHLNAATGSAGLVRVEMQDETGATLSGHSVTEADEMNGNFLDATCGWDGTCDVGQFAGRSIRLHFDMRDAKLYSFWFS